MVTDVCLVVVAHRVSAELPFIAVANRDEFHARPALNADWWPDQPDILGGRDLQAGGSWLAVHRRGRFATVTNYRDAAAAQPGMRSRGELVANFVAGTQTPVEYLGAIDGSRYAGFNLVVTDGDSLAYLSNRSGGVRELPPGVYGLSNAALETPWEKVERSKARLTALLSAGNVNETTLMRLLADREKGPVSEVRSERLPFATAHAITAPFIVLPEYGTRCSTVVTADQAGKWSFIERRFDAKGKRSGESRYLFTRVDAE